MTKNDNINRLPDARGYFGSYGGRFAAETLMFALSQLSSGYDKVKHDTGFIADMTRYSRDYVGRVTPLYFAANLTEKLGGAKVYIKREDLSHTGAHKINNAVGQALLAKHLGKTCLIAETGAGQHGVATATVAALLGFKSCKIFMGSIDMARQQPNVARMKILGAEVCPVENGSKTLSDAVSEAMREWVSNVNNAHYLLGSALGPDPFPRIVRDFQSVIGKEVRRQSIEQIGRLPDYLVACVGGGSNAIGLFHAFLDDKNVKMIGVEAGGTSITPGHHAARFAAGRPGVFHGCKSYYLQDKEGQILGTQSISAGLDYAGVGPEHSYLHDIGRVSYIYAHDAEVMDAAFMLARTEGIIPALESAHALAHVVKLAPTLPKNEIIIVNLSGRGDKDIDTFSRYLKE